MEMFIQFGVTEKCNQQVLDASIDVKVGFSRYQLWWVFLLIKFTLRIEILLLFI